MKKFLLFLATALFAVSCSNDVDVVNPSTDDTDITLSVSVSTPSETRVDIADDGEGGYSVSWNINDDLGCYGTASDSYYINQFTISSNDDFDTESSVFTGKVPWSTSEIRFIHPYNSRFSQSDGVVTVDISAQSVGADLTHLSANTLMLSNAIEIESVTGTYDYEAMGSLTMSHLGAAIELKLWSDEFTVADYTLTEVVISDLPTVVEIDMPNDAAVTVTKTGEITLTADNITATNDTYYSVVFNSFPFTVLTDETVTIVATLYDSEGEYHTASSSLSGSTDVTFAKAQKHTISANLNDINSTEAPQETLSITYDTEGLSSSIFTGQMEIENVSLYLSDIYTYSNYSTISADTGGFISNLSKLEGLSKIVINHYNSSYFTVYQGSTVNPLTSVVTPTTDGNNCTYVITDDNTFFSIVKESSGYINAYSITAYYDSIGDDAALLTGVNPTSLSFDYDDTTAQTVSIEGVNLDKATSITAVSDNTTNFTVSDITADNTFTVTPTAANNTDTPYTATVTVTVDGVSMDIAVSQRGAAQAALITTTITGNDFASGSYTANDGAKTIQYIDFYVTNCYLNSSSIQMAKSSQNDNGVGCFYNTSALIGLSTITVDVLTNSVVVYSGTTENPTTVLTGANGVYTIPAGDQYFKIEATSAYAQVTSVAITYESIEGITAIIDSIDPTSISFEADGGSEDVELTMMFYNNEEITAVSNNDQFTTSVSGTTITVSTVSANSGDSSISGIITISVDGGSFIELPVSQKTNTLEETLVASFGGGSIGGSSYTDDETELTQDGILFGYINCYNNASNALQMNNTTTPRYCYFYNKEAISGLSKVVITIASNNTKYFLLNAGSTSIPDDAEVTPTIDGSVYTYTITDGSEYFMIEPQTTGATYAASIEIYAYN